jgi:coproporphyrinogen III oxidase
MLGSALFVKRFMFLGTMRKEGTMKRQGDLLIVKVDKIPEGTVKQKSRILAEGEATGHMHVLDSGEVYEKGGVLYFKVSGDMAKLNHPEHKTIEFEPGEYKVIRQREYEPRGWRRVED